MARPRTRDRHLPKYFAVIHGSYWYRPPIAKAVRVARVGEERKLYDFIAQRSAPTGPLHTIGDCIDRYLREVLPMLARSTQVEYRRYLGSLRTWCGHMRPDDLTSRDVGRLLDVDTGRIARNRMVAALSALYTKMVGRWYVAEKNPCIGVERHEAGKRDRYVTDAEFDAVRDIMPPRIQIAMDLALITGQRQGDLLALQWSQITAEGVLFRQGKTGKRLLVALSPTLKEVLERTKKLLPHFPRQYVLRRRDGEPYSSDGFRAIWSRHMRKAVKDKMIAEAFTFHDLRAKCVSDSVTIQQAFERAGHSDMSLTRGVYDRGIRKVVPLK